MKAARRTRTIALTGAALLCAAPCLGQTTPGGSDSWPSWYEGGESLPSGIHAIEKDSSYVVTGSTAGDVQDAMDEHAPVVDGRRVQGAHTWEWWHHYQYASRGEGDCQVTSSVVLVRSVIVLPKWDHPDRVDRELVRAWDGYRFRLREHEDGHRSITLGSAADLWKQVQARAPSSCVSLEQDIRALADSVFSASDAEQSRYDDNTAHGLRQGARWPPGDAE